MSNAQCSIFDWLSKKGSMGEKNNDLEERWLLIAAG